jgi:hypothetical protein
MANPIAVEVEPSIPLVPLLQYILLLPKSNSCAYLIPEELLK